MPVLLAVFPARDMNPKIFAIAGFQYQLIEICVSLNEIEPASGFLQVRVTLVVIPGGIAGEGQTDVGSLSESVLRSIGATNLDVELGGKRPIFTSCIASI